MEEFKTIKQAIKALREFAANGKAEHISDSQKFASVIVDVMEGLEYRVEVLERSIGPSSAFIDTNDVPHRLR